MLIVIAGFPSAFVDIFFTGALLTEIIFSLDGLGLLGYEAAIGRDYPVMFATLYFFNPPRTGDAAGGRPDLHPRRPPHRLREQGNRERRGHGIAAAGRGGPLSRDAAVAPQPAPARELPPQPPRLLEQPDLLVAVRPQPAGGVHRQRPPPRGEVRRLILLPGARHIPGDRLRRRLRDRGRIPRPVRVRADRGEGLDPVAAHPVQLRHRQLRSGAAGPLPSGRTATCSAPTTRPATSPRG